MCCYGDWGLHHSIAGWSWQSGNGQFGLLGISVGATGCVVIGLGATSPNIGRPTTYDQLMAAQTGAICYGGWVVRDGGKNLEGPTPMGTPNKEIIVCVYGGEVREVSVNVGLTSLTSTLVCVVWPPESATVQW